MEEHEIVLRDSPFFQRGKRLKKILSLSLSPSLTWKFVLQSIELIIKSLILDRISLSFYLWLYLSLFPD